MARRVTKQPWDLASVPAPVKPKAVAYLLAFRDHRKKSLAADKLKWRQEKTFTPTTTKFRDGAQHVQVIICEAEQKKVFEETFKKKLELLQKDVQAAETRAKDAEASLKSSLSAFFYHVSTTALSLSSPPPQISIDEEAQPPQTPHPNPIANINATVGEKLAATLLEIATATQQIAEDTSSELGTWIQVQEQKLVRKNTQLQASEDPGNPARLREQLDALQADFHRLQLEVRAKNGPASRGQGGRQRGAPPQRNPQQPQRARPGPPPRNGRYPSRSPRRPSRSRSPFTRSRSPRPRGPQEPPPRQNWRPLPQRRGGRSPARTPRRQTGRGSGSAGGSRPRPRGTRPRAYEPYDAGLQRRSNSTKRRRSG